MGTFTKKGICWGGGGHVEAIMKMHISNIMTVNNAQHSELLFI